MNSGFSYHFSIAFVWLILALVYHVLLDKQKSFSGNRIFILFTLLVVPLIPLLPAFEPIEKVLTAKLPDVLVGHLSIPLVEDKGKNWILFFTKSFQIIYLIGVVVALIRLLSSARQTYSFVYLKKEYKSLKNTDAYSFFNRLFISDRYLKKEKEIVHIHEQAHIDYYHSVDKLLVGIVSCVFWWNPVLLYLRKKLFLVHEYQADDHVIKNGIVPKEYAQLLIAQKNVTTIQPFLNSFNYSLKKRITMLYNIKKSNYLNYFSAFLILFITIAFLACDQERIIETNDSHASTQIVQFEKTPISSTNEVYKVVEEQPRFPGCENMDGTIKEKKACSDRKLLTFLYESIQYPEEAKKSGVEGKVYVSFIVEKDGKISDIKLLKDIGSGAGEEVMRVMELMNNKYKWIPGKQKGKVVRVQYNLPVSFKLS